MNSFRPLVYLSIGANATRCFCRDNGLVQGDFAPAIGFLNPTPSLERNPGRLPGTIDLATGLRSLRESLGLLPERREGRMEDFVGHQFGCEQPLENETFS